MGAYGGRKDIMSKVAPVGPVYQAGTLSGNPLAVAAGLAMLRHLKAHPEIYAQLEDARRRAVRRRARGHHGESRRLHVHLLLHPTAGDRLGIRQAQRHGALRPFFHAMLDRGIYLAPSQFEAAFVSAAHTEEDIAKTVAAAQEAFLKLISQGMGIGMGMGKMARSLAVVTKAARKSRFLSRPPPIPYPPPPAFLPRFPQPPRRHTRQSQKR